MRTNANAVRRVEFMTTPATTEDAFQSGTQESSDSPSEPIHTHQTTWKRNFEFRSCNAFLTYPRCALDCEYVLDLPVGSYVFRWSPIYALVSAENHQDGGIHLHCLIQTLGRITTRDPAFFDLDNQYHPNIQAARSPDNTRDYILKDPISHVERGTFQPRRGNTRNPGDRGSGSKDAIMKEIFRTATSKEDYLRMIQKSFPFEWAKHLSQFEYSANYLFPPVPEPFNNDFPETEPDLICREVLDEWQHDNLFQDPEVFHYRKQSLYIVGPSRTGKTTWARSLGTHNYWQNNIDFSSYDIAADYNVIDDIPFKFCPCWKQLVGCQIDFTVNPKYCRKRRIKGGIPSIILCNYDEDWLQKMTEDQKDYFNANCVVYRMQASEKFFTPFGQS
ncbi:replication associated protein [Sugarcane striate virus]|uniref:Replication-associated protein n=1 Tax=Sugarcane striate virus TaxID=1868659 RepID=A0A218KH31_9GEMI|nr:replication associated protein [Sugarcane striate virus]ANO40459.1 replication associated protein [Sugarcane striate virus]